MELSRLSDRYFLPYIGFFVYSRIFSPPHDFDEPALLIICQHTTEQAHRLCPCVPLTRKSRESSTTLKIFPFRREVVGESYKPSLTRSLLPPSSLFGLPGCPIPRGFCSPGPQIRSGPFPFAFSSLFPCDIHACFTTSCRFRLSFGAFPKHRTPLSGPRLSFFSRTDCNPSPLS